MNNYYNLKDLIHNISQKLLEAIVLLEILEDYTCNELKCSTLVDIIKKNTDTAFKNISDCTRLISLSD